MRRAEWSGERGNCSCTCAFGRISGGGGVKPLGRALLLGLAALAAAVVALDLAQPVQAQGDEQSGQIVARRLDDGRTEFGWQPAGGERVLPRARYFPADAGVGRWLNSSPVEVDGAEIGRINARLREDGRIEFAFTPTDGERILPPSRYFPAAARVGRWLRSTEIVVGAAPAATGFVAVSAGWGYTCGLRVSGEIECWGRDSDGQLDAPTGPFSAVSAGSSHTCGVRESGEVECWGDNGYGQLDAPAGRFSVANASWDGPFTCAIRAASGEIECWGARSASLGAPEPDAPPDGRFSAISNGVCALRESGEIECWWTSGGRIFGVGSPPPGYFTAVSAGGSHVCGLRENGEIECWGSNSTVELISTDESGNSWQEVYGGQTDAPPGRFTAVSAGASHTCGLRESREIACWGSNEEYVYADGVWTATTGLTEAPEGSFIAVSVGARHTCAIRESGGITCWGWNGDGQTDAPSP